MAGNRQDTCGTCFFYDYHRNRGNLGVPISVGQVSFTLANPLDIIAQGAAPEVGSAIVFTTTGTLPAPIKVNTAYQVKARLDVNTFQIGTIVNNNPVLITDAGSRGAVHTADYVTMGCHRDAPAVNKDIGGSQSTGATWQPVDKDNWCGDWLSVYPSGPISYKDYTAALGNTGAGALATSSVSDSRVSTFGTQVQVQAKVRVQDPGTATGNLTLTLPAIPKVDTIFTGVNAVTGAVISGIAAAGGTTVQLTSRDGTTLLPPASGDQSYTVTATYEAVTGAGDNSGA